MDGPAAFIAEHRDEVLVVVARSAIEALTSFTYTIHWTTSVPFLGPAVAWVLHGEWNRVVLDRAAGGDEGSGDAPSP